MSGDVRVLQFTDRAKAESRSEWHDGGKYRRQAWIILPLCVSHRLLCHTVSLTFSFFRCLSLALPYLYTADHFQKHRKHRTQYKHAHTLAGNKTANL